MIKKNVIKIFAFLGVFAFLVLYIQYIFMPNWNFSPELDEGETDRYMNFYEQTPDSLDYLVFGPSHSYYSVNPMLIYSETGLRGFNLGGPSQSVNLSYYWMVEACKYQSPSYVFLDVGALLYTKADHDAHKNANAKELLYMQPSLNKLYAIMNCRSAGQSAAELLFPIIQFHTRWNELSEDDWDKNTESYYLKGAYISFKSELNTNKAEFNMNQAVSYELFDDSSNCTREKLTVSPENANYFTLIFQLCQENNITLVPVKFPTMTWDSYKSEVVSTFLQQYGLTLLDISSGADMNIVWAKDTCDSGMHTNYYGSTKTSHYLANYLEKEIGNHKLEDDGWNDTLKGYASLEQEQRKRQIASTLTFLGGCLAATNI